MLPPPPSPDCSSGPDLARRASDNGGPARSGPAAGPNSMDARTAAQLPELEQRTAQAVLVEDFAEAQRLKGAIGRLKADAEQLARLEERKAQAVRAEDLDKAKGLQQAILRLRATAEPLPKLEDRHAPCWLPVHRLVPFKCSGHAPLWLVTFYPDLSLPVRPYWGIQELLMLRRCWESPFEKPTKTLVENPPCCTN